MQFKGFVCTWVLLLTLSVAYRPYTKIVYHTEPSPPTELGRGFAKRLTAESLATKESALWGYKNERKKNKTTGSQLRNILSKIIVYCIFFLLLLLFLLVLTKWPQGYEEVVFISVGLVKKIVGYSMMILMNRITYSNTVPFLLFSAVYLRAISPVF